MVRFLLSATYWAVKLIRRRRLFQSKFETMRRLRVLWAHPVGPVESPDGGCEEVWKSVWGTDDLKLLTIITKRSILDVAAALDPPPRSVFCDL